MTKPIDPAAFGAPAAPADPATMIPFVPAAPRRRRDGWTADRQRVFIQTLMETASVTEACGAADVTPQSAYRLRMRRDAADFNRAWEEALVFASHRLTTLAFERAIHGSPRKIYHKGEVIGEEYVPSDRLLMFLLRHFDRKRYGNLSGFTPVAMPDPVQAAHAALPRMLDRLGDKADEDADQPMLSVQTPPSTADHCARFWP
ncbi:hypothetical protein [Sphingomonas sp.]|uniref:hypothetical protein n=1 Tax=Sphingomonas sp. TaxID=28214 RepID=UPI003B3B0DF6